MRRLIIRPGGIGDCLLAFPAMQYLRADYTEMWTSSAVVPFVHFADCTRSIASSGIDVFGLMPNPVLEQYLRSFDEIVSWYGSSRPEFRVVLQTLGVPVRFLQALPSLEHNGHACDYFAAQVGAPLGQVTQLKLPQPKPRHTVVTHPFSGSKKKNWPLENFRTLARTLPFPVEWTAGPEEPLDNATRFDNLYDLAVWLSGAALYIGNDSGITHLAAAIGVPTIAIFGPVSNKTIWAPRGPNVQIADTNCPLANQPLRWPWS